MMKITSMRHTLNENIYIGKYKSDGQILWEHHLGGTNSDIIETLRVDGSNNIIVIGETHSFDFPVTQNAAQVEYGGNGDIFITKISSSGEILWSTYYGGSSADEFQPYDDGILISSDGEITIWGGTYSDDLQVSDDAFQKNYVGGDPSILDGWDAIDGFIAQFTPEGTLSWGTYLGGYSLEYLLVNFDNQENIIVGTMTGSSDYPVLNAYQETFGGGNTDIAITKISLNGKVQWSTFLGGNNAGTSADRFLSFEFDVQNNIIVHGLVGDGFPITQDVFQSTFGGAEDWSISKISPDGDLIWSTYLGGSFQEGMYSGRFWVNGEDMDILSNRLGSIKLDNLGNIIILGQTLSPDYPTLNAFQDTNANAGFYDVILTKMDPDGNVIFSTYLGGGLRDWQGELFIDSKNNIIITGETSSNNFPTVNGVQEEYGGAVDVFMSKFDASGNLLWSSYLGGNRPEGLVGSRLNSNDELLIVGWTTSGDFPVTDNSKFTNQSRGGFISKINSQGEFVWSTYLESDSRENFNRFSLVTDRTDSTYITGTRVILEESVDSASNIVSFITKVDPKGNSQWSQEVGESINTQSSFPWMLIIIFSSIGIGILYATYVITNSRNIDKYLLTPKMNRILEPVFDSKPSLVYVFVAKNMIDDHKLENQIRSSVPKGILEFKFLLLPIKLSIMKVLYENMKVSTVELRQELGISWNELNYHLNQLKKKRYVHVEVNIVDHNFRNMINIEKQGSEEFEILQSLLIEFVNTGPDISKYLDQVKDIEKRSNVDELYPKDSKNEKN